MRTFMLRSAVAAVVVALTGVGFVGADDKKADTPKEEKVKAAPDTPQTKAVERLSAAQVMLEAGRETKSPLMLLAAAEVIGTTPTEKLDTSKAKIKSKAEEFDPVKEVGDLIKEAKGLAGDKADSLKGAVEAVEKQVKEFKRGAAGGAKAWTGYVEAKYDSSDEFFCEFNAGNSIINLANLSGQGDLDLFVYDLDGRLVARDTKANGSARVQFHVGRKNEYRIVVKAYSDKKPMHYRLSTN